MSACDDEFSTADVQEVATPIGIEGRPKVRSSQTRSGAADPQESVVELTEAPDTSRSTNVSSAGRSRCRAAESARLERDRGFDARGSRR